MKFFKLILILTFISNCSINKVVKHHGVHNLEIKNKKLELLNTNTNDVRIQLGSPSTKSTFDNDVWIYIERKTTSSDLRSLGKRKLLVNNVLVLEFNSKGILVKKDFITNKDMNKLTMSKSQTSVNNKKVTFITAFLSSLRQKINDPLGIKKAK